MTTISVALTTYNGERFLRQQLASIAAQIRRPDELVVSDDQSADGSWAILTQFAATAPFPVRLHRNEARLGWRRNFMRILSMCASDCVALCDQDDVWHPDKLAAAVAAMAQPDVVLFFHNAWLVDGAGARIRSADMFVLPPQNPPLSIHSLYNPAGFSMVFARSLLQFADLWERSTDTDDQDCRAPHDQWLFFLAAVLGTIVYSGRQLADYRQHGGNAMGPPPAPVGVFPRTRDEWRYWLTNPGERFRKLAAAARNRAAILAESQGRLTGVWRERAIAGEQRWSALAFRLECRGRLYDGSSIARRFGSLVELYSKDGYRDRNGWGFSRSALAKDTVLGVLLRPFLRQPGTIAP